MIDAALPQRHSLVNQTTALLHEQILKGVWRESLPGERPLSVALQIGRNTLRSALAELRRAGVIVSEPGSRNRILVEPQTQPRKTAPSGDVAVLSPEPIEQLRPTLALWIDELRGLLSERGRRLRVFSGAQYFRPHADSALRKLTQQNPHSCWILLFSNRPAQQWFEAGRVPCLIAGSAYPDVTLPFRDVDNRAVCRHAAGILRGLGHSRICLFMQTSQRAGDLESVAGFLEGLGPEGGRVPVIYHDTELSSIRQAVLQVMAQPDPPTGLVVANAYHFIAVVTQLMLSGWRIPQDVSVISRDEDPFIAFVNPAPARYVVKPHCMATALFRPILEILESGTVGQRRGLIMPDFVRGESLARIAAPTLAGCNFQSLPFRSELVRSSSA